MLYKCKFKNIYYLIYTTASIINHYFYAIILSTKINGFLKQIQNLFILKLFMMGNGKVILKETYVGHNLYELSVAN